MLRQIKYFQAVVRNNSFSEAAEECHISQSAISQQVQALERELGIELLERRNRKFVLTPAGEYFYHKSLILLADYERICLETGKIANKDKAVLKIGYLRSYTGNEFQLALSDFAAKYPKVVVQLTYGNHEELYALLKNEGVDICFNDQRRVFSGEYVNLLLAERREYIEISAHSPLAEVQMLEPQELKNLPCILVTSLEQQAAEQEYYHNVLGFRGGFLYARTIEEGRMLVISSQGFMPVEGAQPAAVGNAATKLVPLCRNDAPITRNYCAFWKRDNSGFYVEEFAEILKDKFLTTES